MSSKLYLRIKSLGKELGIPMYVIEKDYSLDYILAGIGAQPALFGSLVFKGGTALKKIYFGDYRFSEDLDFSGINAPKGDALETSILNAVNYSQNLLQEQGYFSLTMKRYLEHDPHPFGQEAFDISVKFPWQSAPNCTVKLEIAHDEPVILEPYPCRLLHDYGEDLSINILCYRIEEIIAEKMRCLLQTHAKLTQRGWNKPRARDYYDLWKIFSTFHSLINTSLLPSLLKRKCEHRNMGFSCLNDFFSEELVMQARNYWNTNLGTFVKDLPPCDELLDDLKILLPKYFPDLVK